MAKIYHAEQWKLNYLRNVERSIPPSTTDRSVEKQSWGMIYLFSCTSFKLNVHSNISRTILSGCAFDIDTDAKSTVKSCLAVDLTLFSFSIGSFTP